MPEYTHNSEFPNEIDLGRTEEVPDYADAKEETKTKKRTYYPTLYVRGVDGLGDLPKEGYALIYFKRKSLSITEGKDCGPGPCMAGDPESSKDETTYSAELEIHELCLPEEDDSDMGDNLDKMAQKAGLAVKGKSRQDYEDGESKEEDEED
jgi:hypothetical protein